MGRPTKADMAMRRTYAVHAGLAVRHGIAWDFDVRSWCAWWMTAAEGMAQLGRQQCVAMGRIGSSRGFSPENAVATRVDADSLLLISRALLRRARADHWRRQRVAAATGGEPEVGQGKSRAVLTPEARYRSAADAARAYGIAKHTAAHRARNGLFGWRYAAP